jgi:hypothetical protein
LQADAFAHEVLKFAKRVTNYRDNTPFKFEGAMKTTVGMLIAQYIERAACSPTPGLLFLQLRRQNFQFYSKIGAHEYPSNGSTVTFKHHNDISFNISLSEFARISKNFYRFWIFQYNYQKYSALDKEQHASISLTTQDGTTLMVATATEDMKTARLNLLESQFRYLDSISVTDEQGCESMVTEGLFNLVSYLVSILNAAMCKTIKGATELSADSLHFRQNVQHFL